MSVINGTESAIYMHIYIFMYIRIYIYIHVRVCVPRPHTLGRCVYRSNWLLGAVLAGLEGSMKARRTLEKRDVLKLTHRTQISREEVYDQGAMHRITLGMYLR